MLTYKDNVENLSEKTYKEPETSNLKIRKQQSGSKNKIVSNKAPLNTDKVRALSRKNSGTMLKDTPNKNIATKQIDPASKTSSSTRHLQTYKHQLNKKNSLDNLFKSVGASKAQSRPESTQKPRGRNGELSLQQSSGNQETKLPPKVTTPAKQTRVSAVKDRPSPSGGAKVINTNKDQRPTTSTGPSSERQRFSSERPKTSKVKTPPTQPVSAIAKKPAATVSSRLNMMKQVSSLSTSSPKNTSRPKPSRMTEPLFK